MDPPSRKHHQHQQQQPMGGGKHQQQQPASAFPSGGAQALLVSPSSSISHSHRGGGGTPNFDTSMSSQTFSGPSNSGHSISPTTSNTADTGVLPTTTTTGQAPIGGQTGGFLSSPASTSAAVASGGKTNNINNNATTTTGNKKGGQPLPHNVDICITCVTDKPPQLPLREELPSLGIEVVYNAQGIGAKASQHQSQKMIEKFRHDEQIKDMKKRRLFAPSASKVEQKIMERKRQEHDLEIPRGISYEKYEKILSSSNDAGDDSTDMDGRDRDAGDSTSLCSGSVSTRGGGDSITSGEKRKQQHFQYDGNDPLLGSGGGGQHGGYYHHHHQSSSNKVKRRFEDQSPRNSSTTANANAKGGGGAIGNPFSGGFFQHGLPMKFSFPSINKSSNDESSNGGGGGGGGGRHHHHSMLHQNNPFLSSPINFRDRSAPAGGSSESPSSNPAPSPRYRGPSKNTKTVFDSVMRAFSDDHEDSLDRAGRGGGGGDRRHHHGRQGGEGRKHQHQQQQHLHPHQRFNHGPPSVSESHSGGVSTSYSQQSRSEEEQEYNKKNNKNNNNKYGQGGRHHYRNNDFTTPYGSHHQQQGPPPEAFTDNHHHHHHHQHHQEMIRNQTHTSEDASKEEPSSHTTSRDPSSISTNFTKQDPNSPYPRNPNPVEVMVASNSDPNIKKFLPGLQTVPSGSSSSTGGSSRGRGYQVSGGSSDNDGKSVDFPIDVNMASTTPKSGNKKQKKATANQHLNEAFAAFDLNNKLTKDVYDTLGPPVGNVTTAPAAASPTNNQGVPKRQRKDPPASPSTLGFGGGDHISVNASQILLNSPSTVVVNSPSTGNSQPQAPKTLTPTSNNTTLNSSSGWMNTAKMAFENVAAEVYNQAMGTSNTSSPASNTNGGGGAFGGNIFEVPTPANKKSSNKISSPKQQQPLSPTSTLSSNTANQQQHQQIHISGHQSFLFPNSTNANNNKKENKNDSNNNIFQQGQGPPNVVIQSPPNPFPHHPHVEVHVRPDGSQVIVSSSIGSKSVTAFYEALLQPKTPVDSIQRMLRVCPGLVKVRLQQHILNQKGRMGLHTACARGFPHHKSTILAHQHQGSGKQSGSTGLALQLVEDIQQLKKLISVLVEANRGACTVLDEHGDLPSHLLARTLMEWEAQWYEKVYEKVQTDQDSDGRNAAAITKLYQSMSQCIEIVLHPVAAFCNANNNINHVGGNAAMTLCRAPGSVGLLLPLHIASIFTASVPTLRQLLEQDPMAATVPCNLGHLRTFIPDHSLPLELHDKLSTDFPKWEIGAEARKSKTIQIAGGANMMMEDYMRRSDLLFAFHPTVPRFRMETTRIERLEAKVISEANLMDKCLLQKGERGHLSVAVKRIWIWMCTFQDINDHFQATYYPSVKRIVDSVPTSTIPYLANLKTTHGKALSQVAAPECQALLRTRLEQYETTQASKLEQMVAKAVASASNKSSNVSFADTITTNQSAILSLKGKGYVGVLCRTLFHVNEDTMPTSFILLPYKLTKNEQGKLGIDKKSSATTAVKFAECLLKLTDPKTILYFLEQKSVQLHDRRISGTDSDDGKSILIKEKCKEVEEQLLSLYESGKAYLYLIDELIGLPIVPASGTSLYPIELNQPANIVQKLLPLMLTGMILMRGEKALSVLVNVLLDKTVTHVSPNWVDAAREIISYLYSQQDSRTDNSLPGLDALIDELRAFVSNNSSVASVPEQQDNSEWAVELSILKMVISMNDNHRSFAGLRAKRDEPGTVLWTKHRIEEEIPTGSENSYGSAARPSANAPSFTAGNDHQHKKKKKPDPSEVDHTFSHEDPPGALNGAASVASSNASTKKSGNPSADGSGSNKTGAQSATSPISPLTQPIDSESHTQTSPNSNRDIEKLRLKTTQSGENVAWLDNDKKNNEDVSIGEADSGLEGEELAGVKILLEAEEGPSLLDQESTSEEEGSDNDAANKKIKGTTKQCVNERRNEIPEEYESTSGSMSVTSNTDNIKGGKYRRQDENASGNDSFKRRPVTHPGSSESESIDDKDMYHDITDTSSPQSDSDDMMILTTKGSNKDTRRTNKNKVKHADKNPEAKLENEFYLGDSSQSGELGLAASKSTGNEGYFDATMSNSSDSPDEMLYLSTARSRETPRTRMSTTQEASQEEESETPSSSSTTHQQTNEDDDDSDGSEIKFDFVQATKNEACSHASKKSMGMATISGRSRDRQYDEAHVEEIDHSHDSTLAFSAGKLFEQETMRLQDYAVNHMNRPSSPPPNPIIPPHPSSPRPSGPHSPSEPGPPSPPPAPPTKAQSASKSTSTSSMSLPLVSSTTSSSLPALESTTTSTPPISLPGTTKQSSSLSERLVSTSSPPLSLPREGQTGTPSSNSTPETSATLQNIITATSFGEIERGSPIQSLSTPSYQKTPSSSNSRSPIATQAAATPLSNKATMTLSTRSNTTTVAGRKLLPAKELVESNDTVADDSMMLSLSTPSPRSSSATSSSIHFVSGSENISKREMSYLEMREHAADQALKIDCLETTLQSIKIREDKLLSRGEMLQDFMRDLVDQSENLRLESESQAKRVQQRLGNLEERLLCTEINSQHLSLRVWAIEEEAEEMAEEDYNSEMNSIYESQKAKKKQDRMYGSQKVHKKQERKKQNIHRGYEASGLDEILGRAAKARAAERRGPSDDSDASTGDWALDGYNSSPDADMPSATNSSDRALDGSHSSRLSSTNKNLKRHGQLERHHYYRHRQRRDASFESTTSTTGRSQSQPRPRGHDTRHEEYTKYHSLSRHRRDRRFGSHSFSDRSSSKTSSRSQPRPTPRREYDMNQLLRNASLDERSIEYEMGLAMFGTLDHSSLDNTTSGGTGSYPSPIRTNSMDAYERMRNDYHIGVSVLSQNDSNSVMGLSDAGYSSPDGEPWPDMSSLEGDGLDWAKMKTPSFELPQARFELPHRNMTYRQ